MLACQCQCTARCMLIVLLQRCQQSARCMSRSGPAVLTAYIQCILSGTPLRPRTCSARRQRRDLRCLRGCLLALLCQGRRAHARLLGHGRLQRGGPDLVITPSGAFCGGRVLGRRRSGCSRYKGRGMMLKRVSRVQLKGLWVPLWGWMLGFRGLWRLGTGRWQDCFTNAFGLQQQTTASCWPTTPCQLQNPWFRVLGFWV